MQTTFDLPPALPWGPCRPRRNGPDAPWWTPAGEEVHVGGLRLYVRQEHGRWFWSVHPAAFTTSGAEGCRDDARSAADAARRDGRHLRPAWMSEKAAARALAQQAGVEVAP